MYLETKGAKRGVRLTKAGAADPATELCDAAAKGDVEQLRKLVTEEGFNVDTGDYDKRTAMHLAALDPALVAMHLAAKGAAAKGG